MDILKRVDLSASEIPGTQMNPVPLPCAAKKICVKAGGAVWWEETSPIESYSRGLKCSVMLDTQSYSGIPKTAAQIKMHFEKAQVRQNVQIIRDNSESTH